MNVVSLLLTLEFLVIYYLIRYVSVTILSTFGLMNCYSVRIEQGVSFRVEDQAGPARLSSLARASRLYKTSH